MSQRQNHQLQVSGSVENKDSTRTNWAGLNRTELNWTGPMWTGLDELQSQWIEIEATADRTMAFLFHVTICVTFMRRLADRQTDMQTDEQTDRQTEKQTAGQGVATAAACLGLCLFPSVSGPATWQLQYASTFRAHLWRFTFHNLQYVYTPPLLTLCPRTTCSECVALQDPYCAWDKIAGKCRSHGAPRWLEENYFYQNVATGQHAACPSGELSDQYPASLLLPHKLR